MAVGFPARLTLPYDQDHTKHHVAAVQQAKSPSVDAQSFTSEPESIAGRAQIKTALTRLKSSRYLMVAPIAPTSQGEYPIIALCD